MQEEFRPSRAWEDRSFYLSVNLEDQSKLQSRSAFILLQIKNCLYYSLCKRLWNSFHEVPFKLLVKNNDL